MVGTRLREISSCSSLTVLSGFAWVLLNKIYQPFFSPLYNALSVLPSASSVISFFLPTENNFPNII